MVLVEVQMSVGGRGNIPTTMLLRPALHVLILRHLDGFLGVVLLCLTEAIETRGCFMSANNLPQPYHVIIIIC